MYIRGTLAARPAFIKHWTILCPSVDKHVCLPVSPFINIRVHVGRCISWVLIQCLIGVMISGNGASTSEMVTQSCLLSCGKWLITINMCPHSVWVIICPDSVVIKRFLPCPPTSGTYEKGKLLPLQYCPGAVYMCVYWILSCNRCVLVLCPTGGWMNSI